MYLVDLIQAQNLTINAVDDMLRDGVVSYTVTFVAESDDPNWNNVEAPVTLVNQDNEAGLFFRLSTAPSVPIDNIMTMEGTTGQQALGTALTVAPTGNVTVGVTITGDSDEIMLVNSSLTYTPASHVRGFIPFTVGDDADADGDRPYAFELEVTASADTANYPIGRVFRLPGINRDDETPDADTDAPTLTSTMLEGNTVTLTYSEDLDPTSVPSPVAYTITPSDSTLDNVSIEGTNVTLTFSTTTITNLTYAVPSANQVQDLAGNPAAGFTNRAIGGLSVTITDDAAGDTANIADGDITFTFTWSEEVTGFAISDIRVVGGAIGTLMTVSADVYTLVVTPSPDTNADTITITVAADGVMATADNSRLNLEGMHTLPYDTMAPTPTIDAVVATDNIINAAERTATVPVTGGIASDTTTVTLCAGATTATDPTCGDGTLYTTTPTTGTTWSYTLTTADITALGDVDVTLTVIGPADAAGNQAVSAGRDITIDTMAPTTPTH